METRGNSTAVQLNAQGVDRKTGAAEAPASDSPVPRSSQLVPYTVRNLRFSDRFVPLGKPTSVSSVGLPQEPGGRNENREYFTCAKLHAGRNRDENLRLPCLNDRCNEFVAVGTTVSVPAAESARLSIFVCLRG